MISKFAHKIKTNHKPFAVFNAPLLDPISCNKDETNDILNNKLNSFDKKNILVVRICHEKH